MLPRDARFRTALQHLIAIVLLTAALLALQACTMGPPAVSPAVIASGAERNVNAAELSLGRSLFVSHCLQCHVLPEIGAHSRAEWRQIVATMAARANLQPDERNAVLAYLVAARSTL